MQYVLRGIHGPHAGATYVLGEQAVLGHAMDADIQLVHEGVAARHAMIERTSDGSFVLLDLGSDSGTFVGLHRVTRHVLRPGDSFRIMGSRYAFELRRERVQTSALFHPTNDGATAANLDPMAAANDARLASTAESPVTEEVRRAARRATKEMPRLVTEDSMAAANGQEHWPNTCAPVRWIEEVLAEQGTTLVEDDHSGSHELDACFWERVERDLNEDPPPASVEGDDFRVLDHIREYRELRVRALKGRALSRIEQRRLELLRRQLKPGTAEMKRPVTARRHQRFSCHLPAQLLSRVDGRLVSHPVSLLNISAGGAKIGFGGDVVRTGEHGWLAVHLEDDDGRHRRAVVFRSRIVWTRQPQAQLGVIFSGPPRVAPQVSPAAVGRS